MRIFHADPMSEVTRPDSNGNNGMKGEHRISKKEGEDEPSDATAVDIKTCEKDYLVFF